MPRKSSRPRRSWSRTRNNRNRNSVSPVAAKVSPLQNAISKKDLESRKIIGPAVIIP